MKIGCLLIASLVIAGCADAQDLSKQPPASQGFNGKTIESCKADIQKLCDGASLKQECLVTNWTRISSDCQDGLVTPMRGSGDGGG
jgi:hypothetical protein